MLYKVQRTLVEKFWNINGQSAAGQQHLDHAYNDFQLVEKALHSFSYKSHIILVELNQVDHAPEVFWRVEA